jgi:SAM-dependent methyltransferase
MARDWDLRADELATEALAEGRPTAWFDRLYAEGAAGTIGMPWSRDEPQTDLRTWAERTGLSPAPGSRAVVVGCGLGADAEYLSGLGLAVTAFDVAPTAVAEARRRHPDSAVDYRRADLLDLPSAWSGAFDLVVEVFTVQALPDPPRASAMDAVAGLVAPGGRLVVVAFRRTDADDPAVGPPFPLTRDDLDHFRRTGLTEVSLEERPGPRWLAEYRR